MRVWSMPGIAGPFSEIGSFVDGASGLGVALCTAGALALRLTPDLAGVDAPVVAE